MNEVYREFKDNYSTRTTVRSVLRTGKIEIDCIARVNQ